MFIMLLFVGHLSINHNVTFTFYLSALQLFASNDEINFLSARYLFVHIIRTFIILINLQQNNILYMCVGLFLM